MKKLKDNLANGLFLLTVILKEIFKIQVTGIVTSPVFVVGLSVLTFNIV